MSIDGTIAIERVSSDLIFSKVGVDYAGPFLIKLGPTRRPTIVKVYTCLFVSLSVKAVHIEVIIQSDDCSLPWLSEEICGTAREANSHLE